MNIFWSFVLGTIQGLTEFLPVSSSGHLVLAQSLIPNFSQPGILLDVVLHFGTLFSILFYFRKKLYKLDVKYLIYILIGTVPAVLVGYLLKDKIDLLFKSVEVVGAALIITGLLNFVTFSVKKEDEKLSNKKSLFIGLMQAFAILPGVSRSGSTIFAGVISKINPKKAAEFSFLLSVPAVLGANVLEIFNNRFSDIDYLGLSVGFISAFVFGFIAIGLVLKLIERGGFRIFSFYCLALGIIALLV